MKPTPEQSTAEFEQLKRDESELERVRGILNRVYAERDNAESEVRSLETEVRILKNERTLISSERDQAGRERDEAVALLRQLDKYIPTYDKDGDLAHEWVAIGAFLSRHDAGKTSPALACPEIHSASSNGCERGISGHAGKKGGE